MSDNKTPIGIFDSGYGGLTVFKEIQKALPTYDYIYLGDNARVPYGTRSFETVYQYTKECVLKLFDMGCPLVILACNTASAKALRTLQQKDLPQWSDKKILGVIRPTTEIIGHYTKSRKIGILATQGTVNSQSYTLEIEHFYPDITVYQEACPMWVPLIESQELDGLGAEYFVSKHLRHLLQQDPQIDTLVLACTHYPLLLPLIQKHTPPGIQIISQGALVAHSLEDYLTRHPEVRDRCSQGGETQFFTTENAAVFNEKAGLFYGQEVKGKHLVLEAKL